MGYDERAGRDAGEERPTMTDRVPIFVELCAGTAALSLRLEHPRARPPVSRMGAKTGYADVILRCMGLRPGQGADRYLWCEPDAGVRLLLHAYRDHELATAAANIIRGWADEEPRALWERLRAEGPAVCPPVDAREVARWLWVQGHGDISKPPRLASQYANPEGNADGSWKAPPRDWIARRADALPTLPATIADDARKVDPREVARWSLLGWQSYRQGFPDSGFRATAGGTWPDRPPEGETVAGRLDRVPPDLPAAIADDARKVDPREVARWAWLAVRSRKANAENGFQIAHSPAQQGGPNYGPTTPADRLGDAPTLPATIADDARAIDPPQLPPGVVVYCDPPYKNTTGYAAKLPRAEWLPVVRRWQEAGAMVVVSEAEPIPELMADGWHAVRIDGERRGQKRTFSRQQAEWLTMSEAPRWRPSVQMGLWSRGSV